MSLLSYKELYGLVKAGVVENCPVELINGASIDVTLGNKILVEQKSGYQEVDFKNRQPLLMKECMLDQEAGCVLQPGEFILASSQQIFNLPDTIAAEFKLKSSSARVGLTNLLAGWCDPTWHGSALTLELCNCTRWHNIRLRPGDRIGQVVFFRCKPVPTGASYARRGRYNKDTQVQPIKP